MEIESTVVQETTKKKKKPKKDLGNNWYLSLIVIAMAFIPLIVWGYRYQSKLTEASWYATNNVVLDLYNYYKTLAIQLIAAIMLCFLVSHRIFDKKKLNLGWKFAPLGIYAIFIVLSMVFSEYSYFSLHGLDEQFETMYVLLSYLIMTVFCYVFVTSEKDLKFILKGWSIGILLLCITGLFQLAKHDLLNTGIVQKILFYNKILKDVAVHSRKDGFVYMTLYNSNYVGFFGVLVIPVLMCLVIFTKKLYTRIFFYLLSVVSFLCLLGSGAKNGMVALFVCLLLMPVAYRKQIREHWKSILLVYVSFVLTFVLFNTLNDGLVSDNLEKGFTVTTNKDSKLQDIATNEDNVTITYGGEQLICEFACNENGKGGSITLKGSDGNKVEIEPIETPLDLTKEEEDALLSSYYRITDERFPFTMHISNMGWFTGFYIGIEGYEWGFSNQTLDDGYFYFTPYDRFAKIEKAETAIFTNYSSLASGRGYIWARTIPLLKDNLVLGFGPDTFTLAFPQTDYVEGYKAGFGGLLITKPHCLYLQIGVQTGVLSMIAFIVFNAIYLIGSIRLYWRKKADCFTEYMGIAISFSILGYLISGLVNDSTVTMAPVYWCLIGIGLAVNRINKKKTVNSDLDN